MRKYGDILPGDLVIADYEDGRIMELFVSVSKCDALGGIGRADIITIERYQDLVQPLRFSRGLDYAIRDDYGGDSVPLVLVRAGVVHEVAHR